MLIPPRAPPTSRPYKVLLTPVVLLCSSSGRSPALYLPSLNADIIDNGVVKGDTVYIWRSAADARRHARAGRLLDRRRVLRRATAMGFGRDVRGACSTGSHVLRRGR